MLTKKRFFSEMNAIYLEGLEKANESFAREIRWAMRENYRYYKTLSLLEEFIPQNPQLLDIGAFPGYMTIAMKRIFGAKVSCISIKSQTNRFFEENMKHESIDLAFCDMENECLPWEDKYFDAVIIAELIEHLYNPLNTLKEAHRVLKSGGVLLVTNPNQADFYNRFVLMFKGQSIYPNLLNSHIFAPPGSRPHIRIYTADELKIILRKTGFKWVKTRYIKQMDQAYIEQMECRKLQWKWLWKNILKWVLYAKPSFRRCVAVVAVKQ